MNHLSNRALISRLYTSANEQLANSGINTDNWTEWYQAILKLSDPEKMVYVIVKLNQTVTNGGFAEFYTASLGVFAPEIVHVLNEIGAKETAQIINESLAVVNPKGLLDEAYKEFIADVKLSQQALIQLHSLDIRYDQLDGVENLEDLLGDCLQEMI